MALESFVFRIPNSLGTLENLRFLYLSYNKLWGSLPNSIGNLSSLQYLKASYNRFNGTIPPSFGQLSKLIEFSSNENSWQGIITEDHLVNLTKLESLQIYTNKNQSLIFSNVSYEWNPPFRLKTLYLRKCIIGPQFPIWLQVQTQLAGDVIISDAGIRGPIPNEWVSKLSSQITGLDLSYNLLEGKLADLLAPQHPNYDLPEDSTPIRYPNLTFLYLDGNLLSGSIPSNIGDLMPNLEQLYLSENRLNGTIPLSIQNMSNFGIISLPDNQLSGDLLDISWGKFKSLEVIDLANNNLYGKIPSSIGFLTYLKTLRLSNNHLHGGIPKSLHNCSDLRSIDLSGNRLYGSLPLWIGLDVSKLWLLNLRSNHFSGTIPSQLCNLRWLRLLDLSNNNISGGIPSCLNNSEPLVSERSISANELYLMTHIFSHNYHFRTEKTTLVMKGREDEYSVILNRVLTIDLSRNKLSGEIPNEITNLRGLVALNLSNNDLVGSIPENIGAMQQLETLDLSCNHLSGKIPTSIASLNFLAHLNLSFNNLTGRVPTGKQLQTLNDPSIYEGNSLETKSSGDENANTGNVLILGIKDGKENESEMFGIFISMAIGFPVGLNIWFFTIFTNESRRILYLRFIDRISYDILEKIGFVVSCTRKMRRRRS
ncbi:LRR receptor-like serine/threonine-protein kinase GSO1 [Momordica charantia]|uniref:LRR receptor-like serine/threonine-protein kinase GSO1 n=1 Tax=Momordica charantia TaxID=3673 RepID=A0A6J1DL67_MOMCH|nr:LRR receptor-like serine/threonine-protein kinase GSO1 [Momordica charantia]